MAFGVLQIKLCPVLRLKLILTVNYVILVTLTICSSEKWTVCAPFGPSSRVPLCEIPENILEFIKILICLRTFYQNRDHERAKKSCCCLKNINMSKITAFHELRRKQAAALWKCIFQIVQWVFLKRNVLILHIKVCLQLSCSTTVLYMWNNLHKAFCGSRGSCMKSDKLPKVPWGWSLQFWNKKRNLHMWS